MHTDCLDITIIFLLKISWN